jgi:hypothetical protein
MAISADDFAARDLGLDAREPVTLAHQERDASCLVADVIELQHERVGETAIGTLSGGEKAEHVAPCLCPPAIAGGARLAPVELTPVTDVLRPTLLAPGLLPMKVGHIEVPATAAANPSLPQLLRFGRTMAGLKLWRNRGTLNSPRPHAGGAERHAEVTRDRAHGPPLTSEATSFPPLSHLPDGHTNKCSQQGRTS